MWLYMHEAAGECAILGVICSSGLGRVNVKAGGTTTPS